MAEDVDSVDDEDGVELVSSEVREAMNAEADPVKEGRQKKLPRP